MIPGIDPKVDVAFKKVFGSENCRNLTMSLIDAVLDPPPWQRLVSLEVLNPYTQQAAIDDKLSVLDIKARDDQGRLFNLEMQMVARQTLPERFLYYWARLYSQQLSRGDGYHQLRPTISICFVNGRLFPTSQAYHRLFRLGDSADGQTLTGHLQIHLLEIPNFLLTLADLKKPLDFWLYFFQNGDRLDADALPEPLRRGEIQQAMEVLKVYSQNEMEREIYESRLKAERDAVTQEFLLREAMAQRAEVERRVVQMEGECRVVEQRLAEAEQQRAEAEQQRAEAEQLAVIAALAGQIQLCERLLRRNVTPWDELVAKDEQALLAMAIQLEGLLARSK